MPALKVLFICAAGMSSSLIKSKVEAEAARRQIYLELEAVPAVMISRADLTGADVVLVAPQVRGQLAQFKEWAAEEGAPIEAIAFHHYGLADADGILAQVERLTTATSPKP
ncbi:PTS sugar transporter subunit IIB [Herbiconiux sp. VKM Ac-1786]|uniref:PTS sugar transporter subunit IIB n=1 Tax=Herbiconiux sp. VKM Ac-1786 TaxID=2783824 RepID=UPI00188D368A|nr:PTS sugar transporter subunit IIB [Herbiconiux sp. VKM Ac-1786]MBF4571834.1 PTS sugar transporter subunit IIB [Herbiconiux sp. VKM Ac-1786]